MNTVAHEALAAPLLALQLPLLEACRLGLPAGGEMTRSLRRRGAAYIRLPRACLSQFLLKEPIPPKNLLYVSPFSSANGDS